MEVTKENFDEAFEVVKEAVNECDIMAFDTEFTGFSISIEDRGHDYDSIEDRYQKLKFVCSQCKAIQFGLTTFKWQPASKEYIAQCFNFYILKTGRKGENYILTMKADCMNFLAVNNFDFKKLYTSGITYERLSDSEKILKYGSDTKNLKLLSPENQKRKKQILKEVKKMVFGDSYELKYEFQSDLLKTMLTTIIKKKYPGIYTYYKKGDKLFKVIKGSKFVPISEQVNSIRDGIFDDESSGSDSTASNGLNLNKIEKTQGINAANKYKSEMGFSLVIDEMIKSKKPLVGHNCIYDICFMYDQFIAPLPDTFLDFSREWRKCFPEMYDTKYITHSYQGKIFFTTHLGSLYKKCRKDKSLRNMVKFSLDDAPIYNKYQEESQALLSAMNISHAHEAAFDAFMAGTVFLVTGKYREIGKAMELQKEARKAARKQLKSNGKPKKREMKAYEKDTGMETQISSCESRMSWMGLRGEKVNLEHIEDLRNKVVFDLSNRYFDFSEEFDGTEEGFNTNNVIWVRWAEKANDPPTVAQEDWLNNKIEYKSEKVNIIVSNIAEILSKFGDVTIAKDSLVSAYIEFTSVEPGIFKKRSKKLPLFQTKAVLKQIENKLKDKTGLDTFEVFPYKDAEKFCAKYIHE
ncbi:unnamed protein product [Moneuplotes crassus]|uniref:Uncharacterized protein n=1 Tax=Euplotes crassus TaxID=5936 RepID=A0AAD1X3Q0_EUPCR|nr:unnamed protein product [Moneuplotes crassus]